MCLCVPVLVFKVTHKKLLTQFYESKLCFEAGLEDICILSVDITRLVSIAKHFSRMRVPVCI